MYCVKRVAVHTLGCKVNQYDSEGMLNKFRENGYQVVDFDEEAEVYLVNTCTVTHQGDRKSRQFIRKAKRQNPDAVVVVAGCYPQVSPEEVKEIEGVDLLIGNAERANIVELVEERRQHKDEAPLVSVKDIFHIDDFEELPIGEFIGRTRAALKVQEGCKEFCSYCIIPYARGNVRSRKLEDAVVEAQRLADNGFKELVVTGIHLGAYGRDLPEPISLADLLENLIEVKGLERIRISSIEPMDVDERTLEVMSSSSKICPHLHLPLQSGSDSILEAMRRRYTTAEFRYIVDKARALMPNIAITTDIMVGFPGETEENFMETYKFAEEIAFTKIHVFPYSKRQGTLAARMPDQIDARIKNERVEKLSNLSNLLVHRYQEQFVGEVVEVLVEHDSAFPGQFEGLTDTYLRVVFAGSSELRNEIVSVRIIGLGEEYVKGELL